MIRFLKTLVPLPMLAEQGRGVAMDVDMGLVVVEVMVVDVVG